jgi:hypothetical protein
MAYLRKHTNAVRNFVRQCAESNLDVQLAAMSSADIMYTAHAFNMPRMRQIRKVKNVLAQAFEPQLGNWVVLTTNLNILNMTSDELTEFKKSYKPN